MTMDFKRHLRPEYSNKKRATKSSALGLFQSVELSLLELLPSRAQVRFTQRNKIIFLNLTQFIEHSLILISSMNKLSFSSYTFSPINATKHPKWPRLDV